MTSPKPAEDGNLPAALHRLADAISALCDPKPVHTDQGTRWVDPLYVQLRDSLPGNQSAGGGGTRLISVWVDALDLLAEIDVAVAAWTSREPVSPGDTATIDRLRVLAAWRYRPQDVHALDAISVACEQWAAEIRGLLTPELKLALTDPCPNCGATEAHHVDSGGERVRSAGALTVTISGCRCGACREVWTDLHWLGRVLGHLPTESS